MVEITMIRTIVDIVLIMMFVRNVSTTVCNNELNITRKHCIACKSENECTEKCIKCNQTNGSCIGGCNQTCSGCKNNKCLSGGKCSDGCKAGYYGLYCKNSCPSNCKKHCDELGKCKRCIIGYFGDVCNETCNNNCSEKGCKRDGRCCKCKHGFYGPFCRSMCSQLCPGNVCNKSDGTFSNHSKSDITLYHYKSLFFFADGAGLGTPNTTERTLNATDTPTRFSSIAFILSIAGGGTIFVVVILAILALVIKRSRSKDHNDPSVQPSRPEERRCTVDIEQGLLEFDDHKNATDEICEDKDSRHTEKEQDGYYANNIEAISRATNVQDLPMLIRQKDDIARDFWLLPNDLIKPFTDSQREENVQRNRYKGVFPYNFNRVKLHEIENDYFNASYVDGYRRQNAYIATLGPTTKTTSDFELFWHMVWQECVEKIIMLTNLMEEGGRKCEMYWPGNGNRVMYGNISVTCVREETYADYTLRTFHTKKDSSERKVRQFHYTVWPDKSVPSDITSLIDFRQRVLRSPAELSSPVLIHCSAGVGRTGTYIALDILADQGQCEGCVDIFNCVRYLREQRVNMVQTVEQYQFLHTIVAYALTVPCEQIQADQYEELMRDSSISNPHHIYDDMQKIDKLYSKTENDAISRNEMLTQLNREGADIPSDENRPRLFMDRSHYSSGYINAVYINGITTRKRYIMAQTPLPTTAQEFLTLIAQEKCGVVVDMDSFHDETTGRYLPEGRGNLNIGKFEVSAPVIENSPHISYGVMTISYKSHSGNDKHEVQVYKYQDWDDNKNVPNSPTRFLAFIKEVESYAVEDSPIIVHCRNGAKRSGLVCAVAIILQKLDTDMEINITNIVKQIKSRRPSAIHTREQFVFCHQCATEYIRSLHTYANFQQIT